VPAAAAFEAGRWSHLHIVWVQLGWGAPPCGGGSIGEAAVRLPPLCCCILGASGQMCGSDLAMVHVLSGWIPRVFLHLRLFGAPWAFVPPRHHFALGFCTVPLLALHRLAAAVGPFVGT